jgi:hypothetical protein
LIAPVIRGDEVFSEAIEHKALIEPSAEAAHHKSVSEFFKHSAKNLVQVKKNPD